MAFGHSRELVDRAQQWIAAVSMRESDARPRSSAVSRRHRTKQDLRRAFPMLKEIQDMRQKDAPRHVA
jgi:hypothetical protein